MPTAPKRKSVICANEAARLDKPPSIIDTLADGNIFDMAEKN
jgi:hypothetical protein